MRASDSRLLSRGPRRHCGNPPSRCCGIRQDAFACCLPGVTPAPQQKSGNARAFRSKLQPAACHCGERPDLADHRKNAGSPQPFLHHPQDLGVARCSDQHDARGIEPVGGEPGPVKIQARKAPQDHSARYRGEPSEDVSGKGGCESAVLLVPARSQDLVQSASCEPTAWQHPVDCSNAERQCTMDRFSRPFDPLDALPEFGKEGSFLDHVPFLFF